MRQLRRIGLHVASRELPVRTRATWFAPSLALPARGRGPEGSGAERHGRCQLVDASSCCGFSHRSHSRQREAVAIERAARQVGRLGQPVGQVRHRVDAAAEAVGHRAGLRAERRLIGDAQVVAVRADQEPPQRQRAAAPRPARRDSRSRSQPAAACIARRRGGRIRASGRWGSPRTRRWRRETAHLAFERHGPAAAQLADLAAEQVVAPPHGPGRVRVLAATGDADQPRDRPRGRGTAADRRHGCRRRRR